MANRDGEDRGRAAAVQSVDRALLVMEIIAKLGQAGVTEIAAELGVHKSTVSRLVAVLESRGYVEQLSDRGKYRLGFSIVRLAGSTSAQVDLVGQSQGACNALAAESGETTNIAVLDGDRIINIVEAAGTGSIALRSWVGQSCPAHATSSGKVLLSGLEPADMRKRVGTKLTAYTPHTVTKVAELATQLVEVRENGWASVCEELEIGLNAVAAPVLDNNGVIVAALSVSGPSYRLGPDRFAAMAELAIASAAEISRRLGYYG
ncbi:IclR family transcriptional regulator [Nocardia brasiliensis]|uniref:Glycerol operon regulatory protein n=1 Tax=Nocardia brasiliensis (strain ATCC 700358 / HUJEG-1) TaxID=1133849 RepID=K0EXM3_NOCB7|nr:IclR family transcriptional regulator [Nocardia brasiliensis]AFU01645.1 regulatory proteins IclR [Nocardia brasiliensis ATCC 700358]OCF89137.1 IclR family transcriptional regulator [Nocardia brasiliensis]